MNHEDDLSARGNANKDEISFLSEWELYSPPHASAWSFLRLCSPRLSRVSRTPAEELDKPRLACLLVHPQLVVECEYSRYGRNRGLGVHASCKLARH